MQHFMWTEYLFLIQNPIAMGPTITNITAGIMILKIKQKRYIELLF